MTTGTIAPYWPVPGPTKIGSFPMTMPEFILTTGSLFRRLGIFYLPGRQGRRLLQAAPPRKARRIFFPRCVMPDRSMRSRSWHPAQKAHSESARSTKKQATIIGLVCFAHKKYNTGALGAARSQENVRNVRTGRPQPRCMMPDRSMRSRSWHHPAQKAHSESAKRSTRSRPHNRCHLLRTQKVQSRCARSRPIVRKGAQRAHGPPAAPMHHA